MSTILVTGGAGYIGSQTVKTLVAQGHTVAVIDNLSEGHQAALDPAAVFYQGNIDDRDLLARIFREHTIDAVCHFAASCYVGESVKDPEGYYQNNVVASTVLIKALRDAGIKQFVFSSTCAVYGDPVQTPMTEDHPQQPVNPYGATKRTFELLLKDYARDHGFKAIALRYFNAAGADPNGQLGEDHRPETHLIPLVLQVAASERPAIDIYGDDYATPDGTCVRDYVHVADLAQAHVLALESLDKRDPGFYPYNLGTGKGYSVKEIIAAAERVTGKTIATNISARRPGDPAILVAASDKAQKELGWTPRHSEIETILKTAWQWHQAHPQGYGRQIA